MNIGMHIIWLDDSKINLFRPDGVQHVRCEPGQDYHSEYMVPTIKHGVSVLMGLYERKRCRVDGIYRWRHGCKCVCLARETFSNMTMTL